MNKTLHQVGESPRPIFRKQALQGGAARLLFTLTACISILAVVLICVFLFANGIPGMAKIGVWDFLSGQKWKPGNEIFGILPFILGSIYVTAGALIVGVPAGLLTAIFMSRFASKRIVKVMRPAVSLLAGIPSVVYGFFGLVVLVPLVREVFGGTGSSLLTACVLLGMMILPTIITVSESALNAVPSSYYEGALALGATHERSVFHVVLPAAKSGVMAGIILGIGRAIGEATAVMMVAGNCTSMPKGLLKGVRTLTSNIVLEIGTGSVMRTAVIFFYISNEGVSLVENAAHLGLPIPEKLKAVLEQLHDRAEKDDSGDDPMLR